MKNLLKVALFVATVGLTGCATIVSKSTYPVSIQSVPEGANFTITNREGKIVSQGITPQVVKLKSGSSYFKPEKYLITFDKKGFTKETIEIQAKLDGWYWGNFVIGGPLGHLVIDPLTGAMYRLPEEVMATLSNGKERALTVIDINTLPKEQHRKLQKINL
ncbi:Hsp20/alpha crystallin family protein [Avibacterium sp. 20-15]|uniref:Hsp20/alpha crystallin family protein n=1 Tax=unclassified Avibacterium TaxID=2685287 RepID=UPI0020260828|nr:MULTISPECIES: Hsp20/alpha crystallin family protein [unclassified Avibacterium]MCW9732732.1 Hsp20/alpha crystallin family protein [Avibacterium sp. 20-15]URL04877.1 Hsp20/alpha crystallin family protein [Avibacterium sp. 20-132]